MNTSVSVSGIEIETTREAETARENMSRSGRGTGIDSLEGNRSGSGIWNMNMSTIAIGSEEIGNGIGNMGVRTRVRVRVEV